MAKPPLPSVPLGSEGLACLLSQDLPGIALQGHKAQVRGRWQHCSVVAHTLSASYSLGSQHWQAAGVAWLPWDSRSGAGAGASWAHPALALMTRPEGPIRPVLDQAISGNKTVRELAACLPSFVYCLGAVNILNCCVWGRVGREIAKYKKAATERPKQECSRLSSVCERLGHSTLLGAQQPGGPGPRPASNAL